MGRVVKAVSEGSKERFSQLCDVIISRLKDSEFSNASYKIYKKIDQAKMWLVIKPYNNNDAFTFSYTTNSPDSVRWMFTPDWNIDSSKSNRKQPFKKFGNSILSEVALEMGVSPASLECTSQKWKGLIYKINSDPSRWEDELLQDEYVERTFLFLRIVKPYIDGWINEGSI